MERKKSQREIFNDRIQKRKEKAQERQEILGQQRGNDNAAPRKEEPKKTDAAPPAPEKTPAPAKELSSQREKIRTARENRKHRPGFR